MIGPSKVWSSVRSKIIYQPNPLPQVQNFWMWSDRRKKIDSLVTNKHEFEWRITSKLKAGFRKIGFSGFWCKNRRRWLLDWIHLYKCESVIWGLSRKKNNKLVVTDNHDFEWLITSIRKARFETFAKSSFWCKYRNRQFFDRIHPLWIGRLRAQKNKRPL